MEVEGQKRRFQGQTPKLRTKLGLIPARGFSGMLSPFSMADYRQNIILTFFHEVQGQIFHFKVKRNILCTTWDISPIYFCLVWGI